MLVFDFHGGRSYRREGSSKTTLSLLTCQPMQLQHSLMTFPSGGTAKISAATRRAHPSSKPTIVSVLEQLKVVYGRWTWLPVRALGCIVTLDSDTPPTIQQYHLTFFQFLDCSCLEMAHCKDFGQVKKTVSRSTSGEWQQVQDVDCEGR